MANESNTCKHLNVVIDEHEGIYICTDCAYVISNYFIHDRIINTEFQTQEENKDTLEILARLNLPDSFKDFISNQNESLVNNASNIYIKTNEINSVVTLKEMSSITGIKPQKLAKNMTNVINKELLLEKYCTILDIDFKSSTVIKENYLSKEITGHNPLTVVASAIYIYSKKENKKLSMKKISDVFGISPISIQRYLKLTKK